MKLKKLASNASYLVIHWFSLSFLSALFWVLSGKFLSAENLGIVSTSYNFASIVSVVSSLGIGIAIFKLISEYSATGHMKKVSSIVRSAFKLLIISNLVSFAIIALFSSSFSQFLKIEPQVVVITAVIAVFLSVSAIIGYTLFGFQSMKIYAITDVISVAIRVISTTVLIFLGFSFFGPLMGLILSLMVLVLLRLNVFKLIKNSGGSSFREIFKYSIPALIGSFAVITFNNTPFIILTFIKDLSVTGLFTPAMLLVTPLLILPAVFASASFPIMSGLSAKLEKGTEERAVIELVFRYALFVTLPLLVFIVLLSDQFILLLFKPEYLPATEILPILALGAVLYGIGGILLNYIYAMKHPKTQQNILIVVATSFLLLAISLTFYFSTVGMAIAYFLASLMLFSLAYVNLNKLVKFSINYDMMFKLLLSSIIISAFIVYMKEFFIGKFIVILIILSGLIYLGSLALFRFYNHIDLRLIEYLLSRSPKGFKSILKSLLELMKKVILKNSQERQ